MPLPLAAAGLGTAVMRGLGIAGTALAVPSIVESAAGVADRTLPGLGLRRAQKLVDQAGKSSMRGAISTFLDQNRVQGESALLDFLERQPGPKSFGPSSGQSQVMDKAFMESLMSDNQNLLRSLATRYEPPDQSNLLSRIMASMPPERIY